MLDKLAADNTSASSGPEKGWRREMNDLLENCHDAWDSDSDNNI